MALKYPIRKVSLELRVNIFMIAYSKVVSRYFTTDDKFCFGFIKKIRYFVEHGIIYSNHKTSGYWIFPGGKE